MQIERNGERILPYYQPIIIVERMQVIGYEVLGRMVTPEGVTSLGPFFHDVKIPCEEKRQVDHWIIRQAMQHFSHGSAPPVMFVNIQPNCLAGRRREFYPDVLREAQKEGLAPDRIVLEITEQKFAGSDRHLSEWIQGLRQHGCKIAIDDIGSGFSQLDRIALVRPDFLKVDMRILQQSTKAASYYHLLEGISLIAQKLGAELLLEGIETEAELAVAISVGARYLQGFLFSPAGPAFVAADRYASLVQSGLSQYRQRIREEKLARGQITRRISREIEGWLAGRWSPTSFGQRQLMTLLKNLPASCYRLYVCNGDGYQISANVERSQGTFGVDPSFLGANWTARPYFLSNIDRALRNKTGTLSEPYRDQKTHTPTATFTYALNAAEFLFVDVALPDLVPGWGRQLQTSLKDG